MRIVALISAAHAQVGVPGSERESPATWVNVRMRRAAGIPGCFPPHQPRARQNVGGLRGTRLFWNQQPLFNGRFLLFYWYFFTENRPLDTLTTLLTFDPSASSNVSRKPFSWSV
ncbi:unnamed protein product [Menidia menidia]|uniref:(Atlantic silverside) hypothetical protein n=1 Tax=Menidia menidia TaxID=238744 RepID=A0A8S4B213_9TELE|nr:unnamed protein product [Menidia menidia]